MGFVRRTVRLYAIIGREGGLGGDQSKREGSSSPIGRVDPLLRVIVVSWRGVYDPCNGAAWIAKAGQFWSIAFYWLVRGGDV